MRVHCCAHDAAAVGTRAVPLEYGLSKKEISTWGGRMVEVGSHTQGQGGPQWLARSAAWSPTAGPCASGHRSNPSFERTCQSWLRQLRPAAQVQR